MVTETEKNAESDTHGNTYLTFTPEDIQEASDGDNSNLDYANIKDDSVGFLRGISDGITLPIQHFPEEVEIERKVENKEDEKKRSLNISKIGNLSLKMSLKYTSITRDKQGNDKYTDLPSKASRLFERLTLPIRPPKRIGAVIPRVVEIQLPVVTIRYDRDVHVNDSDISSEKDIVEKRKQNKRQKKRAVRRAEQSTLKKLRESENLSILTGGLTGPETNSAELFSGQGIQEGLAQLGSGISGFIASQTYEEKPDPLLSVEDKKVFMSMEKFTGWISDYSETRKNFDKNQVHNELVIDFKINEILPDKLKKIANMMEKAKVGNSKAVRNKTVGDKEFKHGLEQIEPD